MYSKPTEWCGGIAILDGRKLVRHFLFEGELSHLLQIAQKLGPDDSQLVVEVTERMTDEEVRAWCTWLSQVKPTEAACIVRTHMIAGLQ